VRNHDVKENFDAGEFLGCFRSRSYEARRIRARRVRLSTLLVQIYLRKVKRGLEFENRNADGERQNTKQ